jgi:hypothetical protein
MHPFLVETDRFSISLIFNDAQLRKLSDDAAIIRQITVLLPKPSRPNHEIPDVRKEMALWRLQEFTPSSAPFLQYSATNTEKPQYTVERPSNFQCSAIIVIHPLAAAHRRLAFHAMLIREAATRNESGNESYFTFRLVASERTGDKVRQITLLNLGRHFDLPRSDWPRLCARIATLTASNETIRLRRVLDEDGTEVRLYCHSEGRETEETAIAARFATSFEAGLEKLAAGLAKPRGQKKLAEIQQRIGRLKEKSRGVSQHYEIVVTPDETGEKAASIAWTKTPVEGSMPTHPGVCCLRSNETTWDAETLWHTYTMLTDLEAVFRGLESEPGLRPVYRRKEERTEGHLFITVLAYQLVQAVRRKLEAAGETMSWARLREILSVRRRVTATFRQRDGHTLHVREATVAEPALRRIYDALGIDASPGGVRKLMA